MTPRSRSLITPPAQPPENSAVITTTIPAKKSRYDPAKPGNASDLSKDGAEEQQVDDRLHRADPDPPRLAGRTPRCEADVPGVGDGVVIAASFGGARGRPNERPV